MPESQKLTETPDVVSMAKHVSGSGPWLVLSAWNDPSKIIECMGRDGAIKKIGRQFLVDPPYQIPFGEVSDTQRIAYCHHVDCNDIPKPIKPEFVLGQTYTREEINDVVGGQLVTYLPTVNGVVVAGCFDPKLNPEAPAVVLPGKSPDIIARAERAAGSKKPLPIFFKRGAKSWEYMGTWRVARYSRNPKDYEERAQKIGRTDVSGTLFFEAVSEAV